MASTASTVLRMELMTPGEQDGTWGQKANENYGILESALTGTTAISTTGGTTVLTNVDYVNDQAKKLVLNVTGTLVSNATIQIPNAAKSYKVLNRTTGAYTLSVKTSAGTAVVITQATGAEIYCDGANVIRFLSPLVDFTTGAPATASGAAASAVSVTPSGDLSSTNCQSALVELQDDINAIEANLTANYIGNLSKTKGNIPIGNGSAWAAQGVGVNGYALIAKSGATNGVAWAALIPAATVSCFYQAAAPTGWTVSNTDDDAAMRIVSGTSGLGGGTSGTGATGMAASVVNRTITTAHLPASGLSWSGSSSTSTDGAHTHFTVLSTINGGTLSVGDTFQRSKNNGSDSNYDGQGAVGTADRSPSSSAGDHSHTFSLSGTTSNMGSGGVFMNCKFINLIKASKDAY